MSKDIMLNAGAGSDSPPASPKVGDTARRRGSRSRSQGSVLRLTTDIQGVLPVLSAEVALIAAWWPALAQLLSVYDAETEDETLGG